MRIKSVSGATAVLVLAFFFLPWFTVSFHGQTLGQFSGYQLAVGSGEYALDGLNGRSFLFLVPLSAILVLLCLGIAQYRPMWTVWCNLIAVLAALLGISILLWQRLGERGNDAVLFSGEIGFWLTWLCFIIIFLIAVRNIRNREYPTLRHIQESKTEFLDKAEDAISILPVIVPQKPKTDQVEKLNIKKTTKNLQSLSMVANDHTLKMWLVVVEGSQVGLKCLMVPPIRIGRDPGNDFIIDDTAMSGYHAVAREQGGAIHIQDLNSTNGIYLENKLTQRWQRVPGVTLINEMRIKLGRTVLQVVIEDQESDV